MAFKKRCDDKRSAGESTLEKSKAGQREKDSAAKAKKLAEQMRFRLKEAMAQRGGSAAFLHWLRSGGEKSA